MSITIHRPNGIPVRLSREVWFAIPCANHLLANQTIPAWKAKGYRVALLQDQTKSFEVPAADVIVRPWESYKGWGPSVKYLCDHVVPRDAPVVIAAGDDMYPDPNRDALDILDEFMAIFPDTFGVMQPTGDDFPGTDRICGSPWLGREWVRRAFGGNGPIPTNYLHYFPDEELFEVAKMLGVLRQHKGINQYHAHHTRAGCTHGREYGGFNQCWQTDHETFIRRKAERFPGHEPLSV